MGTSTSNSDAQPETSSRDEESPTERGRNRSPAEHGTHLVLNRPYAMNDRTPTLAERQVSDISPSRSADSSVGEKPKAAPAVSTTSTSPPPPVRCVNPASEVNARLDTQVEVKVYPCNNSQSSSGKKKFTTFTVKPEVSPQNVIVYGERYRFCFVV